MLSISLKTQAQQPKQPYDVLWQKWYYPPAGYDNSGGNFLINSHEESGEDWMYKIQKWYDPTNLTQHQGYIMSGYTSFLNKPTRILNCNKGGVHTTFPVPNVGRPAPSELECGSPQVWKGSQHGAVMKVAENGTMEWYKVFGTEYGEMWGIMQAKLSGGGKNIYTCGRGGTSLDNTVPYHYLDGSGNDASSYPQPIDPCEYEDGYRQGRKIYVVKLDGSQNGDVLWQHTYGIQDGSIASVAYATPGEAYDLAEDDENGIIVVGCATEWVSGSLSKMRGVIVKIDPDDGKILKMRKIIHTNDLELMAIEKESNGRFAIVYYHKTSTGLHTIGGFKIDSDLNDIVGSSFGANEYNSSIPITPIPLSTSAYSHPTFNRANGFVVFDIEKQVTNGVANFMIGCHSKASNNEVYDVSNEEGFLIRLNNNMSFSKAISIGEVSAYDLKVGLTVMQDNSISVVSSTHRRKMADNFQPVNLVNPFCGNVPIPAINPSGSGSWPHGNEQWESDAIVYNIDPTVSFVNWSKLILDPMAKSTSFPDNVKKQLCMYNVVTNAQNELVICGNNGLNFDDVHLIKLEPPCMGTQTYTYIPDDPTFISPLINSSTIFTSTTVAVGTSKKINGTLVIENGYTITFLGGVNIEFTNGQIPHLPQIIIKNGGKLIIDGTAKLTSIKNPDKPTCSDLGWGGIHVENGGELEIINGTIESAHFGVTVAEGGKFSINKWPSLRTSFETFHNCENSIVFKKNTIPQDVNIKYAYFLNDKPLSFSYTNKYFTNVSGLDMFVDAREEFAGSIKFYSCLFENTETTVPMIHGTGILAKGTNITLIKGGSTINSSGGCNVPDDDPNEFIGLKEGVHLNNYLISGNRLKVLEAAFTNVEIPIITAASDNSLIYKNNISWDNNLSNYTNLAGLYKYGIFNSWSENTRIWENVISNDISTTFTGILSDQSSLITSLGADIFKNTISDLNTSFFNGIGCQFDNSNSNISISCDKYQNLATDWYWNSGTFKTQGDATNHNSVEWTQGIGVTDNLDISSSVAPIFMYSIDGGLLPPLKPKLIYNFILADFTGSNNGVSCLIKDKCTIYSQNSDPSHSDEFDAIAMVMPSNEKMLQTAINNKSWDNAYILINELQDANKKKYYKATIELLKQPPAHYLMSEHYAIINDLAKVQNSNSILTLLAKEFLWYQYAIKPNDQSNFLGNNKKFKQESKNTFVQNKKLLCYPNPAANELHLTLPVELKIASIIIRDSKGAELIKQNSPEPSYTANVDISILSKGIYFVTVIDATGKIWNTKFSVIK